MSTAAFITAIAMLFAPAAAVGTGTEVATFSIVACDPEAGEVGVAVASKFLAVGSVVPYAKAGVGAIATQAWANTTYGPRGLDLMAAGAGPEDVISILTGNDDDRERRQLGVVDAGGESATFTGGDCNQWAGGRAGPGYACQGNILVGRETVDAMAGTFEEAEGELALRLAKALKAGELAGGDSRGKQSAAILVVREGGGYFGMNDRYIDLRVDDHAEPVDELIRLLEMQLAFNAMIRAHMFRENGDLEGAVGEMEKACALSPERADVHYDLACLYSLAGRRGEALRELERALEISPDLREHARNDPDLEPLRGDEALRKMLEQ
jgi:uncharacterized Ntn-hydrolase superfamily protein